MSDIRWYSYNQNHSCLLDGRLAFVEGKRCGWSWVAYAKYSNEIIGQGLTETKAEAMAKAEEAIRYAD